MILYLNLDIICSSKLTVFLDHLSRTTFRFSEQTMSADNNEGYCSFIAVTNPCRDRTNVLLPLYSLRSRLNFGERVLSNFITKIMAAIFDNNGSGKLRREINLYQGGGRRSKIRRGVGVGEWRLRLPEVIVILRRRFCRCHFFSGRKKKLPYRFILQLLVCLFLSEDSVSGFSFNSFLLVICLFPEMQWSATNQGVYTILKASLGRRLFALPPPPTSTVHSNYCKSNMSGRINDRELITSACTNKTPALQASPCISQITVYLLLCSLATMIPTSARLELTRAHCWLKNWVTLSDCSVSVRSTF